MKKPLRANVAWGISWGLFAAAFYALLATVLWAAHDRHEFRGLGLGALILLYFTGGTLGGLLLGVLRPLITSRGRGAIVGMIITTPMAWAVAMAVYGPLWEMEIGGLIGLHIAPVLLGGYAGWDFWPALRDDPSEQSPRDRWVE